MVGRRRVSLFIQPSLVRACRLGALRLVKYVVTNNIRPAKNVLPLPA